MATGLAEYVLHQLGRAVGDFRLVGEIASGIDKRAELHDPLDPVERPQRGLHLREQINPASACRRDSGREIHILAETAFDQLPVLAETDLSGNVEDPADL